MQRADSTTSTAEAVGTTRAGCRKIEANPAFLARSSNFAALAFALYRAQVLARRLTGPFWSVAASPWVVGARRRLGLMELFQNALTLLVHRLPTGAGAGGGGEMVEAGLLMSYGANIADMFLQVGVYTGSILKGTKPADLPVLQSTKFEFVINLQTAKALGLEVPLPVQQLAEEVIE